MAGAAAENGDIIDLVLFKSSSRLGSRRTLKFYGTGDFSVKVNYATDVNDMIPGTLFVILSFGVSLLFTNDSLFWK
jgi:hypothetical protein